MERDNIPHGHPPSLLFTNIDKDYDDKKLYMLIENLLSTKYKLIQIN